MSSSCCSHEDESVIALARQHRKILITVMLINLAMFFAEMVSGLIAHSTALTADSLDMLGDAFIYGVSLYALDKGDLTNRRIAMFKGILMMTLGVGLLIQIIRRFLAPELPAAETMGIVGAIALLANLTCAYLLMRHREDNINMKSTWICSRNDVLANIGVLAASGLVAWTGSKLPDLSVGLLIGIVVLHSSYLIVRESTRPTPTR